MALSAGVMAVTIEYAKDLKDRDWFGKQDPYVIVKCGGQQFRSRTATDGGRNPVWNETFSFNIINENSAEIRIYDEDTMSKDDVIGECIVSMAKAREQGHDSVQVPVVSAKSKKQRGFVSVSLKFTSNEALKPHTQSPAAPQQAQPYMMAAPPGYFPAPMPGYAPAPYPMAMPYGYAPAPYPGYAPYPMMQPAGYPVAAGTPPQQPAHR